MTTPTIDAPDHPCNRCGATPTRFYAQGHRCATCTPAALAGLPEPPTGRCAPRRHYCPPEQRCAGWAAYQALLNGGEACG